MKAKVDQAVMLEKRLVTNADSDSSSMTSEIQEVCFEMLSGTRDILAESQSKLKELQSKIEPLKQDLSIRGMLAST